MKTVVQTHHGPIVGSFIGGVHRFRTIPYALPPTGLRRFQSPISNPISDFPIDATDRGCICPQGHSTLEPAIGSYRLPHDENCLTLSVVTPSLRGKHPVAVWIHGGANCFGGGNLPCYDGEYLSHHGDIVVVNVNYRLGAFGFLHHSALNTENLAIQDLILALRWIRHHIVDFRGDPKNVTLFGQSAGANAILYLLTISETEELFRKIVLQSPSIGRGCFSTNDATVVAEHLALALGAKDLTDESIRETLMTASSDALVKAMGEIRETLVPRFGSMLFKPVNDELESPDALIDAAVSEAVRRQMPIIIGTTHDEMHGFTMERSEKVRAIQDARFDGPARRFAEKLREANLPVWKYRFDWKAPSSSYDACHCIELPFVFGTWAAWEGAGMLAGIEIDDQVRLTELMQTYWCEFFWKGTFSEKDWPVYLSEETIKIIR